MIDEKHSGSSVRLTAQVIRMLAAIGVLFLLAACAPQTGGSTDTTTDSSQGEEETAEDESASGDDSESGGLVDVCTLVPDAALEAALGSPPGERELFRGSGETSCAIYGTGADSSLVTITYVALGRDAFEVMRGYVEGVEGLYFEVDGLGEDAFRFGNDVTALQGNHIVEAYLEGVALDPVPDEERLQRTLALLQAGLENLP